jgi:hypothetical protein
MLRLATLCGTGAAVVGGLFAAVGPTKAAGGVFGLGVTLAIFEWPIVGLACVILCSTCFQIMGDGHLTGLPMSLGKLFGALTFGMWVLKSARDRIPMTYSPQMLALLCYVGAMVICTLLVHPAQPSPENGFTRLFQVWIVYWLTANLAGWNRRVLIVGLLALTLGLSICGVIGVMEHFLPGLQLESDDPALQEGAVGAVIDHDSLEGVELRRITGGLGDSNWLAATLAAVMPLNIYWWRKARGLPAHTLVAAAVALQSLAMVLSYTRAGLIGLAVAVAYLVLRRVVSLKALALALVVVVGAGLVWLPEGFVDRMFSVKYLEAGSTPMRKDLTLTALHFALERPVLGYGYGQFGVNFVDRLNKDLSNSVGAWGFELARAIDDGRELVQNIGTHNLYLEIMVEYGLLGLIPFVAFMGLGFRDQRVAERWGDDDLRLLAICLAAGLIAFVTCGMFVHARFLKVLWMLTGFAAAERRVALTEAKAAETAVRPAPLAPAPAGAEPVAG